MGRDYEAGIGSVGFDNKAIRLGFIRKVYGILTVQLSTTFGAVLAVTLTK